MAIFQNKFLTYITIAILIVLTLMGVFTQFYFHAMIISALVLVFWIFRDCGYISKNFFKHKDIAEAGSYKNLVDLRKSEKTADTFFRKFDRETAIGIIKQVFVGNDVLINTVLEDIKLHFAKKQPQNPLVISIVGPSWTGKTALVKTLLDYIMYCRGLPNTTCYQMAYGNDSNPSASQVNEIAKLIGVGVFENISQVINDNHSEFSSAFKNLVTGEDPRTDSHLVIFLVDTVDTGHFANMDMTSDDNKDEIQKFFDTLYGNTIAGSIASQNIILDIKNQPIENIAHIVWFNLIERVRKEYGITLLDFDENQTEQFMEWMAMYVVRIQSGEETKRVVNEIYKNISNLIIPAVEARKKEIKISFNNENNIEFI